MFALEATVIYQLICITPRDHRCNHHKGRQERVSCSLSSAVFPNPNNVPSEKDNDFTLKNVSAQYRFVWCNSCSFDFVSAISIVRLAILWEACCHRRWGRGLIFFVCSDQSLITMMVLGFARKMTPIKICQHSVTKTTKLPNLNLNERRL